MLILNTRALVQLKGQGPLKSNLKEQLLNEDKAESFETENNQLLCSVCSEKITHLNHKDQIESKFQHTFVNPHNQIYKIGIFKKANGIKLVGNPTHQHTWFNGFAWQNVLCQKCSQHLGWKFTNAPTNDQTFFGLILLRLKAPWTGY